MRDCLSTGSRVVNSCLVVRATGRLNAFPPGSVSVALPIKFTNPAGVRDSIAAATHKSQAMRWVLATWRRGPVPRAAPPPAGGHRMPRSSASSHRLTHKSSVSTSVPRHRTRQAQGTGGPTAPIGTSSKVACESLSLSHAVTLSLCSRPALYGSAGWGGWASLAFAGFRRAAICPGLFRLFVHVPAGACTPHPIGQSVGGRRQVHYPR